MITRPEPEARATADRVRALGWRPVIAPLLHVEPTALALAADWLLGVDGVVVTSANALAAIAGLADLPMLAVGDATAARARAAGFTQVASAGGNASDLAAAAPRHFPPGAALLFPTACNEGLALAAALQQAGFRVSRRVAYSVRAADRLPETVVEALVSGRLHAALFLSTRTARIFGNLLPSALHGNLAGIEAIAIGQPAGDVLTLLPWGRVRVSLTPTLEQVLALL